MGNLLRYLITAHSIFPAIRTHFNRISCFLWFSSKTDLIMVMNLLTVIMAKNVFKSILPRYTLIALRIYSSSNFLRYKCFPLINIRFFSSYYYYLARFKSTESLRSVNGRTPEGLGICILKVWRGEQFVLTPAAV